MFADDWTPEQRRDMLAELRMMRRVSKHKNVITLIGWCVTDGTLLSFFNSFVCLFVRLYIFSICQDIKDNVRMYSIECLHQLLKSRHLFCCSISLNPYMVFQTWNHEKKVKRKAILLLAYIADVSCITNRSFYMRTLSLK